MDQFPEEEIDETSLAIELSLLDHNKKGNKVDGNYVVDAEQLARAIEESLKSSKKPSYKNRKVANSTRNHFVCDVCDQPIPPGKVSKRDFWNQIFCENHLQDGTPMCCGCERLQPRDEGYINLGDHRAICSDCHSTAIMDTEKVRPVLRNVLYFFKEILYMEILVHVPVFMVDRDEMRKHRAGTSIGPMHSMVWGLTIYSGESVTSVANSSKRGMNILVGRQTYNPGSLAILILFGLPMVVTGAIMAHEFTHAWLRLRGVRRLEPKIEEGIAQVIAYKWLDWFEPVDQETSSSDSERAQYMKNLKRIVQHKVENHLSKEYGDGFRDAQFAVARHGLPKVMDCIVRNETLPE